VSADILATDVVGRQEDPTVENKEFIQLYVIIESSCIIVCHNEKQQTQEIIAVIAITCLLGETYRRKKTLM